MFYTEIKDYSSAKLRIAVFAIIMFMLTRFFTALIPVLFKYVLG